MKLGEEINNYKKIDTDCFYEFAIPFTKEDSKNISLISTYHVAEIPFEGEVVPEYCLDKTRKIIPPKKQITNGILSNNVICKNGLELIFKSTDKSPACVKSETKVKLIERGWTVLTFNHVESIWIEQQIGCMGGLTCYISWLESYYPPPPYPRYGAGYLAGANFTQNTAFIKDYFKNKGIEVFDVKYDLVWESFCEGGECTDKYLLKVQVTNTNIPLLKELGFKISNS